MDDPSYLSSSSTTYEDIYKTNTGASQKPIRSLLAVTRYRLNTYGRRAFSVAGPTVWNSLPDFMRDPTISADSFRL